MTDLRSRLADALRKHRPSATRFCTGCDWDGKGRTESETLHDENHLLDVLLSLPGIAIVELPESTDEVGDWPTSDGLISSGVWINPLTGFVRFQANQFDAEEARSVAAALLAAANAAEAVQ